MANQVDDGIILVPFMTGKGGTERVIQNLFHSLSRKNESNIRMTVYSIGGSDNYDWTKGVPNKIILISRFRKLRTLYYLFFLPFVILSILKKNKPSFVISTNPIMWFISKMWIKLFRYDITVIAWYHYSLQQKPIKKILLNGADYYLAISSGIKEQLISNGINPAKISLIYNPVKEVDHLILRPKSSIRFLYIGRLMLDGQKNIRELFVSLSRLKGSWTIDLIGDIFKNDHLREFAEQLNIGDKIVWHGFSEDPWNEISESTALVLTSKYEGLPMVLCEAITRGVYCVSADVETGPKDIINNDNGELYSLGNVDQLTTILQLIVDGKRLPSEVSIHESAYKFRPDNYAENFEKSIFRSMDINEV